RRLLHERQLAERALRAHGGTLARAAHGRVRRLRRRPRPRRAPRRPCRDHAVAAHPADPGGTGLGLPRAARADRARRPVSFRLDDPPAVRVRAHVRGTVQGVGFRPYVYRLARAYGLGGYVLNDARGVTLEVEGPRAAVEL